MLIVDVCATFVRRSAQRRSDVVRRRCNVAPTSFNFASSRTSDVVGTSQDDVATTFKYICNVTSHFDVGATFVRRSAQRRSDVATTLLQRR